MRDKYLYIQTMGCQMNVYDSAQMRSRLAELGYLPTTELSEADVILVNTCAIRAKAEQKAFSFLGRLLAMKESKPELIIGVGGCVAQQEGRRILSRMPHVDLVFGTQAIPRLPQHVRRIAGTRCRVVDVELVQVVTPGDFTVGPYPHNEVSSFVTIMRGCDNYCAYCVVPYVRGREASRAPEDILDEIRHLVAGGVREVTLLGQNVNSYGQKEGLCSFAGLLRRVHAIDGLQRIRFTTSHPKDLSDDLIAAFQDLPKLCRHIHLPVQSGSDLVLKRMNRRYTRAAYLEKAARLKAACPDIAITSDIIVGFPGESESDFEQTLSLIAEVGYDSLFAFMYSDRPNAAAVHFPDKVDEAVKSRRLQAVLDLQGRETQHRNEALVGTVQEILVDGCANGCDSGGDNPSGPRIDCGTVWGGRTVSNKIVHFPVGADATEANQVLTGRLMNIMIERAMPHSLWGRLIARNGLQ